MDKIYGYIGVALTLLKFPHVAWIAYTLHNGHQRRASASVLIVMLADIADGKMFNKSSLAKNPAWKKFRRLADVSGDRVAIDSTMVAMTAYCLFPVRYYAVEIAREVILLGLIFYGFATKRPLEEPNNPSRAAAWCVGCMAIAWLWQYQQFSLLCLIPTAAFGIWGLHQYYRTIIQQCRQKGAE